MHHVVIPLDRDHRHAWAELVDGVTSAADLPAIERSQPHITLIACSAPDPATVCAAIEEATATITPFVVHAHGYGFFCGDEPRELSLHVTVVRSTALDRLHRDLCAAVRRAGAEVAGWSEPDVWAPHITLLDRGLDPVHLAKASGWLARRHHPSWWIPVDRVALTGGWPERDQPDRVVRLDGARFSPPPADAPRDGR